MSPTRHRLMLRWSWRDLRRRWGLVVLTAVIIAIGTGTYGGLGGTTPWRLDSLDESYQRLEYHDLRVRLPMSVDVPQGTLTRGIATIRDADLVAAAEERLIAPTQVDASTDADTVLVPGEVVGLPVGQQVDDLHVITGRAPRAGQPEAVLEVKFADARDLPPTGTLRIAGGQQVRYVGTGVTPEYFQVLGSGQQVTGAYGFAVMFMALDAAQDVTGRAGRVNDAVVRLAPGADRAEVAAQIERSLAEVGATVETRADDAVRRSMYADARNDEKMWAALSLLILLGASFAAFNLVTRMVEAERHEIGVAMALGTPVRRLSVRPLLVGLQIAVLGVVLGVGVGAFAGWAMRTLLVSFLPLPVWLTPFPAGRYAQAALLGIALPMLATVVPVRRALRVEPVDALRAQAGSSTRRSAGLAPKLTRRRHRGRVVATMPVRNVARSPRRTLLTALGIAASITTLVAVLGMLDSLASAFERSDTEVAGASPDRLEATLSSFQPEGAPVFEAIGQAASVSQAETGVRIGGTMRHGDQEVQTFIDVVDLADAMWTPSIASGRAPIGRPGLIISEKAAADLGVGPGDTITLDHPVRVGTSYRMVDDQVRIAATHPNPLRFYSYVDTSQIGLFNLDGVANTAFVRPAPGHTADDVKRELFEEPGVSSVQEVAVLGQLLEERLGQFTGILRLLEGFGLVLALLIALNSATLAMEERRREQATMFAFGLPARVVMRTIVVEMFITAVVGTIIGIGAGYVALTWLLHMFTTETFPELGLPVVLEPTSVATVLVLGVGVASLAPLFAWRRLQRTDIPSTLRVLE